MRNKIFLLVFIVLLLLAGIIALTQETDDIYLFIGHEDESIEVLENWEDYLYDYELSEENNDLDEINIPEWAGYARWYRSNTGGMALEEIPSRLAAMRNEYALVIDYTVPDDLPQYLRSYYSNNYYIEIRTLYKNTEEIRMQWIFRDNEAIKLLAVIKDTDNGTLTGFIETYGDNSLISSEIIFHNDGSRNKKDFYYNNGIIVRTEAWQRQAGDETGIYQRIHTDYYRYNRSFYLRNVVRVFYDVQQINIFGDSVRIAFPNRIMDAAHIDSFIKEKHIIAPEYFGDTTVTENNRLVFTTDTRGRVLTQTLYEEDDIVWVISNKWSGDRIISINRTDEETDLLTEFEYDPGGNRSLEKNFRNGILERIVRTENNIEIEELYIDDRIVLTAIWEDGRKISETRALP